MFSDMTSSQETSLISDPARPYFSIGQDNNKANEQKMWLNKSSKVDA